MGIRTCLRGLALVAVMAGACAAADAPVQTFSWAFPQPTPTARTQTEPPPRRSLSVPGSTRRYDQARIEDLFRAVDWFPNSHPVPPRPVMIGRQPDTMACGYCHLPDGQGRPENAALAGLPAAYIAEQLRDMAAGARTGANPDWGPTQYMLQVAKSANAREVAEAARYFAALKYAKAFRLVEAREIPTVTPIFGLYSQKPGGGRERLGQRIVEVPNDVARFELRDNRPGYTVYVPEGAVARGQALAEGGSDGRFPACASCHGAGLKGGLGPPLAGRYPAYIFRQLQGFSVGRRAGAGASAMAPVARQMKPDEMIDLAAYAASLKP